MTVHYLPTKTIPPVDWDEALQRTLERYADEDIISTPRLSTADIAEQVIVERQTKSVELASKQTRLLQLVRRALVDGPDV